MACVRFIQNKTVHRVIYGCVAALLHSPERRKKRITALSFSRGPVAQRWVGPCRVYVHCSNPVVGPGVAPPLEGAKREVRRGNTRK